VKLPSRYEGRLLYDGTESKFKDRVLLYKKNRRHYHALLDNQKIISYSPFQFLFPSVYYFSKYNLIEEGFSAYSIHKEISNKKGKMYELFKSLYIGLLFPFASKNIKGFLMGISYSSRKSNRSSKLFVSSIDAYGNYNYGEKVEKRLVPICGGDMRKDITGQRILVMDRLNKKGRPFDDKVYLSVLKEALLRIGYTDCDMLVKLHPADILLGQDNENRIIDVLEELNIKSKFINDNLEELALSNAGNSFIGTNSTSLYYAPIFGSTNKSISFSRLLAKVDEQYSQFLEGWGGTEKFCEIFSKQVNCL
jgi:hypothetical protein